MRLLVLCALASAKEPDWNAKEKPSQDTCSEVHNDCYKACERDDVKYRVGLSNDCADQCDYDLDNCVENLGGEPESPKEPCEDDPSCQERYDWMVDPTDERWQEIDEKCCRTDLGT